MQKIGFFLAFLLLTGYAAQGQFPNLVPNPDFEQSSCRYDSYLPRTPEESFFWYGATNNWIPYYNQCTPPAHGLHPDYSFLQPHSGKAFILIDSYGPMYDSSTRNYAQVKLTESLQKGCRYEVSFYYKLPTISYSGGSIPLCASDGLGVYFSTDSFFIVTDYALYWIQPQVENPAGNLLSNTSYRKFSGYFTASGGERYLTLGNFKTNAETQFLRIDSNAVGTTFYIDDVSLRLVPPEGLSLNLGADTAFCSSAPFSLTLEAQPGFQSYLWSTGDTSSAIIVSQPGNYWVRADFGCGALYDTVNVQALPPPVSALPFQDTTLCHPEPFAYTVRGPSDFTRYRWNTGATNPLLEINQPGVYILHAFHPCLIWQDTLSVAVFEPPAHLILGSEDTSFCEGESLTLSVRSDYSVLTWSTGSRDSAITITDEGRYGLRAYSPEHCLVSDSATVHLLKKPPFSLLPEDSVSCLGLQVELELPPLPPYDSIIWRNSFRGKTRTVERDGLYSLKVSNRCFEARDSIRISFTDCTLLIPNLFTPNGDGKNETFQLVTEVPRPLKVEVYNRWGRRVFQNSAYDNLWEGKNLEDGIYFYSVYDSLLNKAYKGSIQILR